MTDQQFIKSLKKPGKFHIIWNYFICVSVLSGGILFLSKFFNSLTPVGNDFLPLYASIFLLSIGIYGFWRIQKDYKIIKIECKFLVEEKKQIVDEYILLVKGNQFTMDQGMIKFQYRNKYWNSINVFIAINEDSFLLNAKSAGSGSSGFIDFGLSRRAQKKSRNVF